MPSTLLTHCPRLTIEDITALSSHQGAARQAQWLSGRNIVLAPVSRYYWVLSAGTELLHLHGGEMVILHLPGGERTQVLPSSVLVGAY